MSAPCQHPLASLCRRTQQSHSPCKMTPLDHAMPCAWTSIVDPCRNQTHFTPELVVTLTAWTLEPELPRQQVARRTYSARIDDNHILPRWTCLPQQPPCSTKMLHQVSSHRLRVNNGVQRTKVSAGDAWVCHWESWRLAPAQSGCKRREKARQAPLTCARTSCLLLRHHC